MEHRKIPPGQVGVAHNWEYANALDRMAAVITDAADLKKLALQRSDWSYWILVGVSPTTWAPAMGPAGQSFMPDAVGTLAERSAYDNEPKDFSFLATDEGKLYFRSSETPGEWSDPVNFGEGPQGPKGDTGDTGPGLPPGGTIGQLPFKAGPEDFNTAWRAATKADVGLNLVDNTPDSQKPVSAPQQTALNAKADQAAVDAALAEKADAADVDAALDGKVDKVAGLGLSQNSYTDEEKLKLAGLNEHWRGTYTSLAALQAAVPTANPGDYALVDPGFGEDAKQYNWDEQDGWVLSSGGVVTNTDAVPEGATNLYFTVARVLAAALTGLSVVTGSAVVASDSILVAIGKLQGQINSLLTSVDTLETQVADLETDVESLVQEKELPFYKHPYVFTGVVVIGDGERAVSAGWKVDGEGSIIVTGDGRLAAV